MLTDTKKFLIKAFKSIISDVQAESLYKKTLHRFEDTLYFRNTPLNIEPKGKLVLAGSGKASIAMGQAFLPYLSRHSDDSLFISPFKAPETPFRVIPGDHPVPGKNSLKAGRIMRSLIGSLNEDDVLLYFLSGGSSSLMEMPVGGVNMAEIQETTHACLARGLSIYEINTLRTALSKVKAGQLARICKATCHVFVLSDVIGNDLSIIGSGPFYPTKATPEAIAKIIDTYELENILPSNVIKILSSYVMPEYQNQIPHYLIGSNMDLLQAAETICVDHGIKPLIFPESLFGEAKQAGKMIADMLKLYTGDKPVCMIFGGETTVTLNDQPGLGGRAQELALATLSDLKDNPNITVLSAGSDGMDGVGGAAGAIVSAETYQKAQSSGLSIEEYLKNHDSYHFHKQCDSLIRTGYSGTNVGDMVLGLIS